MASTNTSTSASTSNAAPTLGVPERRCSFYSKLCSGNKTGAHSDTKYDHPCGCCMNHCLKERLINKTSFSCHHVLKMMKKQWIDTPSLLVNQAGKDHLLSKGFVEAELSPAASFRPVIAGSVPKEQKQVLKQEKKRGREAGSSQDDAHAKRRRTTSEVQQPEASSSANQSGTLLKKLMRDQTAQMTLNVAKEMRRDSVLLDNVNSTMESLLLFTEVVAKQEEGSDTFENQSKMLLLQTFQQRFAQLNEVINGAMKKTPIHTEELKYQNAQWKQTAKQWRTISESYSTLQQAISEVNGNNNQ